MSSIPLLPCYTGRRFGYRLGLHERTASQKFFDDRTIGIWALGLIETNQISNQNQGATLQGGPSSKMTSYAETMGGTNLEEPSDHL
jgi:hypothetical protein